MATNRDAENPREQQGSVAALDERLKRQEREDPSGHGMQVKPGQQREIEKTSEPGPARPAANETDEDSRTE